jgi:EAL domain-containing protein (putative c-di-GMP-specific phosphodiesterase class I)
VIRKAIAQCAAWRLEGLDLTVAVNLSALDLFDSELPTFISGFSVDAELPPSKARAGDHGERGDEGRGYALKILAI